MAKKPTPLSGFPELLPEQRVVEQHVLDTLRRTFELHGFAGVETRAVEPMDQLLRKGDTSKEVYVLRRLQEAEAGADAGIGLHFDLTVPFARYVLENAGKLEFPFRRFQIQKVWRGERPQEGRYREFTQADIDIIGRDALPTHHDVEVARVMVEALTALEVLPPFRVQVNNRKLIQGFYAGLGVTDSDEVMRLVDKLDKLPAEEVRRLLVAEAGASERAGRPGLALAAIAHARRLVRRRRSAPSASSTRCSTRASTSSPPSSTAARRWPPTASRSSPTCRIARGLDYYTGTVFETRLRGQRGPGVHLLRRPVRRPGRRRAHDVPGRGHLARRQPGPGAAARPRRA